MIHRKKEHAESIKICNNFISKAFRFKTEACWFRHEEDDLEVSIQDEPKHEEDKQNDVEMTESVFQNVSENLKPPY